MAGLYPYQQQLLIDLESYDMYKGRGTLQITGRQTGKSHVAQYLNLWMKTMRPEHVKLTWRELPGNKLQAFVDPTGTVALWGLREQDMEPIQEWSEQTNCGKRMSFDMWHFKSRKHMTMFLLKWTS